MSKIGKFLCARGYHKWQSKSRAHPRCQRCGAYYYRQENCYTCKYSLISMKIECIKHNRNVEGTYLCKDYEPD